MQVDLADVEVDVRDCGVRRQPAQLVVHTERQVEVVPVEVHLGEALDVDLGAVWLGRGFAGLWDDRLDQPVVRSCAVEGHGGEDGAGRILRSREIRRGVV